MKIAVTCSSLGYKPLKPQKISRVQEFVSTAVSRKSYIVKHTRCYNWGVHRLLNNIFALLSISVFLGCLLDIHCRKKSILGIGAVYGPKFVLAKTYCENILLL